MKSCVFFKYNIVDSNGYLTTLDQIYFTFWFCYSSEISENSDIEQSIRIYYDAETQWSTLGSSKVLGLFGLMAEALCY